MHGSRVLPALGVLVVLTGVPAFLRASTGTATLELEVTQGMQYVDHAVHGTNAIPLVAGRTTIVRTSVSRGIPTAGVRGPVTGVRAELKVEPARGIPAAGSPVVSRPLNRREFRTFLNSSPKPGRESPDSTLNFRVRDLPPGLWDFTVEIEVRLRRGATVTGSGTARLKAVEPRQLRIRLVPLQFTDGDDAVVRLPPDPAKLDDAVWLLKAAYPLPDDVEILWESSVDLPTLDRSCARVVDHSRPDPAPPVDEPQTDVEEVLRGLKAMWSCEVDSGAVSADLLYYGFMEPFPAGPYEHPGLGDEGTGCSHVFGWSHGPVGVGTTRSDVAGKVLCHEVGHMFDLSHCGGGGCGPDSCDLAGQVGWDVYGGPRPSSTQHGLDSFMVCGEPTTEVWVTPGNFRKSVETLKTGSSFWWTEADPVSDRPAAGALVIQGALKDDGRRLAWLDPIFRFPWRIPPTPEASRGDYVVEASDAQHQTVVSRRFSGQLRVELEKGAVGLTPGFFSVVLPFPEEKEVETVSIRRVGSVLRAVTRSRGLPALDIAEPQSRSVLEKETVIRWSVEDADTESDNMLFHVVYSPDGGGSFEPVAVNLKRNQTVFDPKKFAGSSNGLLRVLVSDGLNTAFADVTALRVTTN